MGLERRFAIIVGSNRYKHKPLAYSLKDAQDIKDVLEEKCDFQPNDIILILIDENQNNSSIDEIELAFSKFKKSGFVRNISTFFFYFSGHGYYDKTEEKSNIELSDNEKISIQRIYDLINDLSGKNNYLVIDSCQSGGKISFDNAKTKLDRQLRYNSRGIYCLFSSTDTKLSYEPNSIQSLKKSINNSYFTHFFIEALKDKTRYIEGYLSMKSVDDYISYKTQIYTEFDQIPVAHSATTGFHPFGIWKDWAKNTILNKGQAPTLSQIYIPRQEDYLINLLKKDNVLLLSGLSFCGKSQVAKRIAYTFWIEGYTYKRTTDIFEAERYLNDTTEKRLCLLEDPCGHNINNITHGIRQLNELIENIPSANKLIVTSKIDILLSINKNSKLEQCNIGSHNWHDLTVLDIELLLSVWVEYVKIKGLSAEITDKVCKYLKEAEKDSLLQIGHLVQLSNYTNEALKNKNITQLCHISRLDSKELSVDLINRGKDCMILCTTLVLLANTVNSASLEHVGYVINNKYDAGASYAEEKDWHIYTHDEKEEWHPLIYTETPTLSLDYLKELDYLIARGYIWDNSEGLIFSHPNYLESFNYVLLFSTIKSSIDINQYLSKALSCISSENAFSCSKKLSFLYKEYKDARKIKIIEDILELSLTVYRRSVFPKVRDKNITFLLECVPYENENFQNNIFNKVASFNEGENIIWVNDIAYIHEAYNSFLDKYPTKEEIELYNNKLSTNEAELINTNAVMWKALISLDYIDNLPAFSLEFLKKCITADEVFIREKAAFIICSRSNIRFMDDEIIDKLFVDEHPNVIFQAIKGLFISYSSFDESYKSTTSRLISESFNDPMLVIRVYRLMMTFGIDYGHESLDWRGIDPENNKEMWNLWGETFPVFLSKCPKYAPPITTGRFSHTLDQGIKYLNPAQGLALSRALFKWTTTSIQYRALDTHELAMLSFLLPITNDTKTIRFQLFKDIFSIKFSGFTTYNLATAIYYWDRLTSDEQEVVINLLKSDRFDVMWLQAVSLTQDYVPGVIQELLLGDYNFFDKPIRVIVNRFPQELLIKCLKVFFGKPQPLWWYGYHHNNMKLWIPIVKYILKTQFKVGLNECINEFVFDGVNGFPSHWGNAQKLWTYMVKNYINKSILLESLTLATSECSCSIKPTSALWKSIIKAYQEANIENEALLYIASNIEILQQTDRRRDLYKFWDFAWVTKKLLPKLEVDSFLMHTVHFFSKNNFSSMSLELAEKIYKIYLNVNVRFFFTFEFINMLLENDEINPDIKKILSSIPDRIDEIGSQNLNELKSKEQELDSWVFLHDSGY